jgi:triacylglycerol lipase
MSSRHLIDPELIAGLEALPSFPFTPEILPMIRAGMMEQLTSKLPTPEGVIVEERSIPSPEGHEIGLVISKPAAPAAMLPAVLHIHGGGYVIGSAATMNNANMQLVLDAECVVVSVDYRLSPETSHPGPVEDCYAALKWLHTNAAALGVDPARIAVSGESAGGGLAAALALLTRDRGEVKLIHQHLIYPMIDDRTCTTISPHPYTGAFVWTPDSNRFGWASLLGHEPGRADVSAYAAAARAVTLEGLPPTYIAVGALDLFLEEDIDYARRLLRAGVPTELHVYPGAYHGFDMVAEAQIVHKARSNSLTALRRALHPA